MTKITKQNDTESIKECSRCHIIKSGNEFKRINGYAYKICKACQNELNKIRDMKAKSKIIIDYFNGKCFKCDTDISMLPALDFHHLDKSLKTISYWKLKGRSYNIILQNLRNDNVQVLCVNCHVLVNATVFKNFKNLILDSDIHKNTPYDFERKVDDFIENYLKSREKSVQTQADKADIKYKIKIWIKKRIIIEQMYEGKCIGCRNISIKDNLPSFNFHHFSEDKKKKGNSWRDIKRLKVEKIVETLYQEKCISLCANCHRMQHNINFKRNYNYVIEKNYAEKTMLILKRIKENIENFKLKNININYPIGREFSIGEIWIKYLLEINYISKKKKKDIIDTTELSKFINRTRQITNKALNLLLKRELIEIVQDPSWIKLGIEFKGRTPRKFKLTDKSKRIIPSLLLKHPEYQVSK